MLGRSRKGRDSDSARILVSAGALLIDGHAAFPENFEISLRSIRRVVVDDGTGWAYTTATCRFPIFDRRSDGSGTGALVGPLWATSPSLLPDGCRVLELDPVPSQVPNVALIFDPWISTESGTFALMMLRAEDPDVAHELLGARLSAGPMGLEVLDYLKQPGSAEPTVAGEAPESESAAASA